jgi:hypothetical protein
LMSIKNAAPRRRTSRRATGASQNNGRQRGRSRSLSSWGDDRRLPRSAARTRRAPPRSVRRRRRPARPGRRGCPTGARDATAIASPTTASSGSGRMPRPPCRGADAEARPSSPCATCGARSGRATRSPSPTPSREVPPR